MSLSVLSSVFSGANQTGSMRLYGVGKNERYRIARRSDLQAAGLSKAISSAEVFASSDAETTLILMGSPFPFIDFPDFSGAFQQFTNPKGASKELDVNLTLLDNRATSLMLVAARRRTEFRISFRDVFLDKWNSILDAQLGGSPAKRDGNPTLTWQMFPKNISYLDADRIYLKIHQDLDIELDWWPDYEASISYHVFLYVNGDNNLRGYVARWAYWVEGGVKSDDIADELEPKVIEGMGKLNEELSSSLSAFDGVGIDDVYYLPGRQLGGSVPTEQAGFTTDDVTIVVEL
jgi:hypothetical protein